MLVQQQHAVIPEKKFINLGMFNLEWLRGRKWNNATLVSPLDYPCLTLVAKQKRKVHPNYFLNYGKVLSLELEEVIQFLFWSKNPSHSLGLSSMNSMKINPWKFTLFFCFCKLILWKHNFIVWIRLCLIQMSVESELMNKSSLKKYSGPSSKGHNTKSWQTGAVLA